MTDDNTSDNLSDNQDHCDFSSLQSLLWARNTQDLIDSTHEGHYERFRSDKLLGGASQVCCQELLMLLICLF